MRKYIILSLIFIICLGFLIILPSKADSGWDADYNGGGSSSSWGSGGSSSSSSSHIPDFDSYDYGSKYNNHSSNGSSLVEIIVFITIAISAIIYLISRILCKGISTISDYSNKSFKNNRNYELYVLPYDIEKIKKVLPDFNKDEFKDIVYDIYVNIQKAWMNFDYEVLRKYTSDELYNLYYSELEVLKLKKEQNIMEEFELHNFEITEMEHSTNKIALEVHMIVDCYDYVINKNKRVIRGTKKYKNIYEYELTLLKGIKSKSNKCPNCGAPIKNQNSITCEYCDTSIINSNHDWVLSKKRIVKQTRKEK